MKINKHFHTKHGKNTGTQDHSHTHARAHTYTRTHTQRMPIKSACAPAHTHMAEKDMGGRVVVKTTLKARAVIKEQEREREYWSKYCLKRYVLRLVLKAGREGL